ncbi:uncharacterized protein [Hetaerina americana]|uniref:uncharacterized protein n=1 Tax=Hetaerina americana TaxID=62018 RepID=UPI003A7F2AC8
MSLINDRKEEEEKLVPIISRIRNEYCGKAFNNHKKLSLLNLKMESLPRDMVESLEMCAKFSQILGLEDINENTLLIRSTELLMKEHQIHEKQFEIKLKGIKVKKILKDLENQTLAIKRMCGKALDDNENFDRQNEKKVASIAFLQNKLKSYNEQVTKLDITIAEIQPSVDLKEIVECHEQMKSMDEEIKGLQNKLDWYRNLPPNMILAEEKLKGEKSKLEECEEELSNFVDNYAQLFK